MRTPLGVPDCCFFVEPVGGRNLRADVPFTPAMAHGSASDCAAQTRRAQHHSIGEHPMPRSAATSRPTTSGSEPTETYRNSRAYDIDGLASPMLGHRNGAREVRDRGRSVANLAEIVVQIFDPADPIRSKRRPFGAGANNTTEPVGRRRLDIVPETASAAQCSLSMCAPSVSRQARRWRRASRCRPATSQGGCAPWPEI